MKNTLNALALLVAFAAIAPQARADEEPAAPLKPFYVLFKATTNSALRVFINKRAPEGLKIVVKNESGQTLYEEYLSKQEPGKAYLFNLREQPDGLYTVEVSGKGERVTRTFALATPDPLPKRMLVVR